jgi:hypothetical protein
VSAGQVNAWIGNPSPVCIHAKQCGRSVVIEHNGDVYACDHCMYVPNHSLLIRSTAPNPDFQIGVKSAAQYQPRANPGLQTGESKG